MSKQLNDEAASGIIAYLSLEDAINRPCMFTLSCPTKKRRLKFVDKMSFRHCDVINVNAIEDTNSKR